MISNFFNNYQDNKKNKSIRDLKKHNKRQHRATTPKTFCLFIKNKAKIHKWQG